MTTPRFIFNASHALIQPTVSMSSSIYLIDPFHSVHSLLVAFLNFQVSVTPKSLYHLFLGLPLTPSISGTQVLFLHSSSPYTQTTLGHLGHISRSTCLMLHSVRHYISNTFTIFRLLHLISKICIHTSLVELQHLQACTLP